MKASEIMIGDLVKLKTDNDDLVPCKIGELSGMLFVLIDGDEIMDVISYDDVEPITLTADILKANGFKVCYESCHRTKYIVWLFDDKVCVEAKFSKQTEDYNYIKIYLDGVERINIHILHVHEFQHALRLCGIDDLADNFKID